MPEKLIKPSDNENVVGVEDTEISGELIAEAGEAAALVEEAAIPTENSGEVLFVEEEPAGAASIPEADGQTGIGAFPIEIEPTPAVAIETAPTSHATERRQVVKAAALVSIGNLGSSVLGMVRQIVVSSLGPTIAGPFNAALTPANSFYQLLINGSVSGALVPTFNDYAAPEKREEMRRVVFTVVNLILLLALVASVGYALVSPWFVNIFVSGYRGPAQALTLRYSQIIFFSLVALGPFAVLLSALFALKEFGWPAFATAAYHVGIILGAIGLSLLVPLIWGPWLCLRASYSALWARLRCCFQAFAASVSIICLCWTSNIQRYAALSSSISLSW